MARPDLDDRAAIDARRALLRQQTQLVGEELPWLVDPDRVPADAIGSSADLSEQYFQLAVWIVTEVVQAARRVEPKLGWEDVLSRHRVTDDLETRVVRAVLDPATQYAPGILAVAEIVAAVPDVASRDAVPRRNWARVAMDAEALGAKLSCDGTDVQVLVRDYLRKPPHATANPNLRVLDAALLCTDDSGQLTTVTPIDALVSAAKTAAAAHIRPPRGMCVAMQAKAPGALATAGASTTMYGAIWSSYAAAAARLIFPRVDTAHTPVAPRPDPDPHFALAFDELARRRGEMLRRRQPQ